MHPGHLRQYIEHHRKVLFRQPHAARGGQKFVGNGRRGRQLDVPMPTTATTNEFLTAARGMGLAEKDFAVVFDVLAQMSGVHA